MGGELPDRRGQWLVSPGLRCALTESCSTPAGAAGQAAASAPGGASRPDEPLRLCARTSSSRAQL